jgi:hypothetical protein
MKAIVSVLAAGLCGLGLIAAMIFLGRDRDIFTSPPEAVAENFVRSLATRRLGGPAERALPEDLKECSSAQLHELSREVARSGALLAVNAREVSIRDNRRVVPDRADVLVRVRRVGGDDLIATVPLQQSSSHAWQIANLDWHFTRP